METVFQFDKKLTKTVNELALAMSLSKEQVLLRAITLYKLVQNASNECERIMLVRTNGEIVTEREIILP